jgi:hypothetical protein
MKYILLIVGLSIIVIVPLLLPGFILTHDMYFPLFRLYGMEQCFNEGQIPPRWVSSFALGYGYPFFNFYAPFAYYLAYLFHLVGFGYVYSIHATIIFGFIFGGIGTYFWVKEILKNKLAAVLSVVVYLYFPYHLVQVYVRGDISEFIATAFFSWVLFFFHKILHCPSSEGVALPKMLQLDSVREYNSLTTDGERAKFSNRTWYLCGASITYAAVILSHNIMAMVFTAFFLAYIIFLLVIKKQNCLLPTAYCLLGLLFGLGLSAYFWLPALAEKQFVSIQSLVAAADYRNHFVTLFDLINPRWGLGGSEAGALNRMSVQVGLAPILFSLTSLLLISYKSNLNLSQNEKNWYWFSWIMLLILMFLMLPISKPIWEIIPMMKYILYPWRLLALIALPLALLSGYCIILIRAKQASPLPYAIIAITITIALSSIYLRHRSIPVPETALTPEFIWNCESAQKSYGTTMSNEYLPQTVSRMPKEFTHDQISVIAGEIDIQPQTISGIKRIWNLDITSPGIIRLNTFYFPGWQVYLDGKKYPVETDGTGKMLLAVSEGQHTIKLLFENTFPRKVGNYVSLISLVFLILYLILLHGISFQKLLRG